MSQDFTDDCFASGHATQTDMTNVEKNFAALKSAFSGTASPSNLVAGMWWFDKTTNILKLRNEANNAWQSVWNFANNKPVITNLSNEITGAMIAAAIKDPAAGTAGLRTLGTGAQQAMPGYTAMTPSDGSVTSAKLVAPTAGNNIIGRHDMVITVTAYSYVLKKSFSILQAGAYRIKFDLKNTGGVGQAAVFGRIYKNQIAIGTEQSDNTGSYVTKSQDISGWSVGDTCELWLKISYGTGYAQNFRLSVTTVCIGVPIAS